MPGNTFQPTTETIDRGDLIKKARMDHGHTQVEMAKAVGTTRPMISYWEHGKAYEIPFPSAKALHEKYGIALSHLLSAEQKSINQAHRLLDDRRVSERAQPGYRVGLPEIDYSMRRLSDDALTLAMLFDELPDDDPSKAAAKQVLESSHRQRFPKRWGDGTPLGRKSSRQREKAEKTK